MSHRAEELIEPSDRTYSDQQVAIILRRAAELKERSSDMSATDGLSLEMVREIAAEIGVEPRFVDRAAALMTDERFSRAADLFGGPFKVQLRDDYARDLSEEDLREVLRIVRQVLQRQGEAKEALGSLEWTYEGLSTLSVTVAPRGEGTSVQIIGDRTGEGSMIYTLPIVAGLGIAGIIVDAVQPGLGGMVAILGTGGVAGVATARTMWSVATRSFRRRIDRLRFEIARFMDRQGAQQ